MPDYDPPNWPWLRIQHQLRTRIHQYKRLRKEKERRNYMHYKLSASSNGVFHVIITEEQYLWYISQIVTHCALVNDALISVILYLVTFIHFSMFITHFIDVKIM